MFWEGLGIQEWQPNGQDAMQTAEAILHAPPLLLKKRQFKRPGGMGAGQEAGAKQS